MSLDTQKLHRLKGKSFDKLYADHAAKWKEMVENARDYAQTCVGPNEKVRIGDVVEVVQNAIRIDPMFEKHTKDKSLPNKFWVSWFAEYVVDCVYPQPDLKGAAPKKPS
jgi:predicted outer membrane protein